ncbi:hypothetical protein [Blastococcus deserti]|uniref:Uncharacterized protein n=1 Tax=Blastococcus deserti TaxID=2259033 RepID=A0ABW4XC81_9ACTN
MTQPPGPYGDPYGRPDPYGPPAPPAQPGPYGPPNPYAHPGPYGPPPQAPPPPQGNLLPWLILGAAVLLSGIGVLLVLLLGGGDRASDDRNDATAASSSSASPPTSAEPEREPVGDLPGGAQVAEPTVSAGGAFPGSDGVALTWVKAMAEGDFQTAYDLSCVEVQQAATAAAAGGDPAYELARYFYEQTLGGVGFTEGTFDSIQYDDVTGTDIGAFTLALDNGETFTLLVYVQEDLTVCDFA